MGDKQELDLGSVLEDFKREEKREDEAFLLRQRDSEMDSEARKIYARDLLKGKLRRATVDDYKKWLEGYMRSGKKPTHSYDYLMPDNFYVVLDNFELEALYGSNAIEIIVPKNVRFLGGELGHINLYFMDGFENKGGWVPVYDNIKFD
jgi:hypothetical protein